MPRRNKFDYFKAYERLTKLAVSESELLIEAIRDFKEASGYSDSMDQMHEFENEGDTINHDIFSNAAVDFMPPFDREDVVGLAQSLDNVLDYIDDVLGHMYMYDIHSMPENALRFGEIIRQACITLDAVMCEFHNFKKNRKIGELIVDINSYEEEADKLYQQAIRELHTGTDIDVMHVLVWSRIYDRMEKCCDAAEHAADLIGTVMMKNM